MPAARSVKDVPERFVKDVMELDSFSRALAVVGVEKVTEISGCDLAKAW
jgi:hypothetical protein